MHPDLLDFLLSLKLEVRLELSLAVGEVCLFDEGVGGRLRPGGGGAFPLDGGGGGPGEGTNSEFHNTYTYLHMMYGILSETHKPPYKDK